MAVSDHYLPFPPTFNDFDLCLIKKSLNLQHFLLNASFGQIWSSKSKIAFWVFFGNHWTNFHTSFKIHINFAPIFQELIQFLHVLMINTWKSEKIFQCIQNFNFFKIPPWYFKFFSTYLRCPHYCMSPGKWQKSWATKCCNDLFLNTVVSVNWVHKATIAFWLLSKERGSVLHWISSSALKLESCHL